MSEDLKKINITGTNNKYQINKLINNHIANKDLKKRVQSEKWQLTEEHFDKEYQLQMIVNILNNNNNFVDEVSKIAIQEINKKIYGYKQQDNLKKKYNEEKFLTYESIIEKMVTCELKCRYCNNSMNVIYDISREMTQWSVDRIDNDLGHNIDNYHLACLDCNLKRRRRSDDKFLFTKQLNIIKQDN